VAEEAREAYEEARRNVRGGEFVCAGHTADRPPASRLHQPTAHLGGQPFRQVGGYGRVSSVTHATWHGSRLLRARWRAGNIYFAYAEKDTFHTYLVTLPHFSLANGNQLIGNIPATAAAPKNDPQSVGFSTPLQVDRGNVRTTVFPWVAAEGAPATSRWRSTAPRPTATPTSAPSRPAGTSRSTSR